MANPLQKGNCLRILFCYLRSVLCRLYPRIDSLVCVRKRKVDWDSRCLTCLLTWFDGGLDVCLPEEKSRQVNMLD